ncbi:MTMR9 [Bugula neritina]|uniref:MTMR9 n=1 Tax=Bugula neritina TaxID=10212 RepID=A0A7J7K0I7_BUGNE|nr:MTMR9 [Bugula neritina]
MKGPNTILLYCKDFQIVSLTFPPSSSGDCAKVASSINKLSNIVDVPLSYPFYYTNQFPILEDGWLAFTLHSEFAKYTNKADFRITDINRNFQVCSSYSSQVLVPKSVEDEVVCKAASHRQSNRFPVLSYIHKATGTYLARASQIISTKRCKEDEALLNAYVLPGKKAFIVDIRTYSSGRPTRGKESESNYPLWKYIFRPVQKWQALQDSFTSLIDGCISMPSTYQYNVL